MAEHHLATISDLEHPAPHRDRVKLLTLIFGLSAAPVAWVAQLYVNYAVTSYVCSDVAPKLDLVGSSVEAVAVAVGVMAVLVAVASAVVAYRSWRTTRHETSGQLRETMDVGHGRTRFLSLWGLMLSLGFLLAIVFTLLGFFVVPLCGS